MTVKFDGRGGGKGGTSLYVTSLTLCEYMSVCVRVRVVLLTRSFGGEGGKV